MFILGFSRQHQHVRVRLCLHLLHSQICVRFRRLAAGPIIRLEPRIGLTCFSFSSPKQVTVTIEVNGASIITIDSVDMNGHQYYFPQTIPTGATVTCEAIGCAIGPGEKLVMLLV